MKLLDREIKKSNNILLVDGYNIINAWDFLKDNDEKQLEESRRKLIEILIEYKHYTRDCVILVFDSYRVKSDRQMLKEKDLIIVYTRENETADNFIERMVVKYAKKKHITVATSDKLEQDLILGKGANRISAKELEIEIQKSYVEIKKLQDFEKSKNKVYMSGLNSETVRALEKYRENIKEEN